MTLEPKNMPVFTLYPQHDGFWFVEATIGRPGAKLIASFTGELNEVCGWMKRFAKQRED